MRSETGTALRIIGPLIEVVCLGLLFASRGRRLAFAGLPLEYVLYTGLALGFSMVMVGLTLVRRPTQKSRTEN
jgi:hypothetical protein